VSAFLVTMSARMRARGYSSREFHLRMSRAEIGSYLGVTMETVSRTLSALARRGVVEVQRKYVRILDPEALQVEAEAE
jgi:CRP/FNR family transcriptional regulator